MSKVIALTVTFLMGLFLGRKEILVWVGNVMKKPHGMLLLKEMW